MDGKVYAAADDGTLTEQQVPAKDAIARLSLQENTVLALDASGAELARFENGAWVEAMSPADKALDEMLSVPLADESQSEKLDEIRAKVTGEDKEYSQKVEKVGGKEVFEQVIYETESGKVVAYVGGDEKLYVLPPEGYTYHWNGTDYTFPFFANLEAAYDYIFTEIKPEWGKTEHSTGTDEGDKLASDFKTANYYDDMINTEIFGKFNFCKNKLGCSEYEDKENRIKASYRMFMLDDGRVVLELQVRQTEKSTAQILLVDYDPGKFHKQMQKLNEVVWVED